MILNSTSKFVTLLFVLQVSVFSLHAQIATGKWEASLQLDKNTSLPLRLEVQKGQAEYAFTIVNAEERIALKNLSQKGDTFTLQFPDFNSVLKFKISKKKFKGYWINYNRGNNYQIPFSANLAGKTKKTNNNTDFTGKWKTVFDVNTPDSSFAIGVFSSKNNHITGTFLTETGDYGFLEGAITGNKMYLSCLDGSHAFLFTGELNNGKITGKFHSGTHYSGNYQAIKDEKFELKNPEKITYLTSDEPLKFEMKDLNGDVYTYPNQELKNKVVIIQIMGTWCPNCLDETNFLKQMHEKYSDKGLEIIAIGYETPNTFEEQAKKIQLLKDRHQLDFQFLVGGKADKQLVSKQFSMLNSISSFPTSIFIDREGNITKIHTGFNGPGTGDIYKTFVKETEELINKLLNQR
ncbi:MAG: TlpA disulfide reductase family protein [Crocinitomicaceae bacterium]|nr:TlpA disulfide reductase family protein [Crocinitomicaceae bacterium]